MNDESRRAYKRYILEVSASLFTADGKEEPLLLKNLSGVGACACGNYPFKINELVTITIKSVSPNIFKRLLGLCNCF